MNLQELIKTRRTVHNFTPEKIDEGILTRALELSLWAPNHKLTYPWVYKWIDGEARTHLAELGVELKRQKGPLSDIKAQAIKANVTTPSHVLALGVKRAGHPATEKEDYATLSCSVQIASMVLWEHGIATKWSTGGWAMNEETYRVLGFDPAEVRLEGALLIGKPQTVPAAPKRPELAAVLRA